MENIKKLTTKEIVEYIELTNIICQHYQKSLMDYNGIIQNSNEPFVTKARKVYDKCINVYNHLLDEGEKRIIELIENKSKEVLLPSLDKNIAFEGESKIIESTAVSVDINNKSKEKKAKNVKKTKK